MFAVSTLSVFAQKFEACAEIKFLEGSDAILANFAKDFSDEALVKTIASKITKYEIKRFQGPFGNTALETIIKENKKATVSNAEKTARIFFTHPNKTMAVRMANLCAKEYIEFQKVLMCDAEMQELQQVDSSLAAIEPQIQELDRAAVAISDGLSSGRSISNDKANQALEKRLALTEKKNDLHKRRNQLLRTVAKAKVPVKIEKSAR